MSYKIIGDRRIAGKEPGSVVAARDLEGCNIPALIEGGHIEEQAKGRDKADKVEAD